MFVYTNPNPKGLNNGDCVIRAIAIATNKSWRDTYWGLCYKGDEMADLPNADVVYGAYLKDNGFFRYYVPNHCADCYTVHDFCKEFPEGTFLLSCSGHAIAVIDGNYYDTVDSGSLVPIYFWKKGK